MIEVEGITEGLREVGGRPPLSSYLGDAWKQRSFALTLARYRLTGELLQNRLGVLWIVLRPLTTAAVYSIIFHFLLSGKARPDDFVPYVITGVFVFDFFTGCFGSGARAITGNAKLVQTLGFPRILLPVSIVIEQAMRMIPVVLLLAALLLILGQPPAWSWLLILPILAVMAVFNLGVGLIMARLSVWTRDVQQLIPTANRILFYGSSIFYQADQVLEGQPVFLTIIHLVPTFDFVALARGAMISGYEVPPIAIVAAPLWAVLAISIGIMYFWRAEARYGLGD